MLFQRTNNSLFKTKYQPHAPQWQLSQTNSAILSGILKKHPISTMRRRNNIELAIARNS